MKKRSLFFYVLIAYLIIGVLTYFFGSAMTSLLMLIVYPIIFRLVIGLTWKDAFGLGFLNAFIVFVLNLFFLTTTIMMEVAGEDTSGSRLAIPLFIMVIGVVVSMIYINWRGKNKRIMESSLLDNILDRFRQGKGGEGKKKGEHKPRHLFSFKTFLIYWLTFTVGYFISVKLVPFIQTKGNLIALFLLTGLILELSAKVTQMIIYKKPHIKMDKMFVLWVIIHSIVVFVVLKIISYIPNLPSVYLNYLAVGLGIAIITHLIWRFMYKKQKK